MKDNEYCGVKVMTKPHTICQNDITGEGSKVSEVVPLSVVKIVVLSGVLLGVVVCHYRSENSD